MIEQGHGQAFGGANCFYWRWAIQVIDLDLAFFFYFLYQTWNLLAMKIETIHEVILFTKATTDLAA